MWSSLMLEVSMERCQRRFRASGRFSFELAVDGSGSRQWRGTTSWSDQTMKVGRPAYPG